MHRPAVRRLHVADRVGVAPAGVGGQDEQDGRLATLRQAVVEVFEDGQVALDGLGRHRPGHVREDVVGREAGQGLGIPDEPPPAPKAFLQRNGPDGQAVVRHLDGPAPERVGQQRQFLGDALADGKDRRGMMGSADQGVLVPAVLAKGGLVGSGPRLGLEGPVEDEAMADLALDEVPHGRHFVGPVDGPQVGHPQAGREQRRQAHELMAHKGGMRKGRTDQRLDGRQRGGGQANPFLVSPVVLEAVALQAVRRPQVGLGAVDGFRQGVADVEEKEFHAASALAQGARHPPPGVQQPDAVGRFDVSERGGETVSDALAGGTARLVQDLFDRGGQRLGRHLAAAQQDGSFDGCLVGAGGQETFEDGPDAAHLFLCLVRYVDERVHGSGPPLAHYTRTGGMG